MSVQRRTAALLTLADDAPDPATIQVDAPKLRAEIARARAKLATRAS